MTHLRYKNIMSKFWSLFQKFWIWDFEKMIHQFGKSWFGFSWKILKLGENIWSYVSDNNFIEPPNNLRSIIYVQINTAPVLKRMDGSKRTSLNRNVHFRCDEHFKMIILGTIGKAKSTRTRTGTSSWTNTTTNTTCSNLWRTRRKWYPNKLFAFWVSIKRSQANICFGIF